MEKKILESKIFEEFLASCEIRRLEELDVIYSEMEHYKAIEAKDSELYEKLKSALAEDMHGVLLEYGDQQFNLRMAQRSYFYKYGFMDSAHLTKVMYGGGTNVKLDVKIV